VTSCALDVQHVGECCALEFLLFLAPALTCRVASRSDAEPLGRKGQKRSPFPEAAFILGLLYSFSFLLLTHNAF